MTEKGLSAREREVATLAAKGLRNKEIANQLFVTEKTVKFHLTNIYKKLNTRSRTELVIWSIPFAAFIELPKSAQATESKIDELFVPSGEMPLPTTKIGQA